MVQYPIGNSLDGHPNNGLYLHATDIVDDFSNAADQTIISTNPGFSTAVLLTDDGAHQWEITLWNDIVIIPNVPGNHNSGGIGKPLTTGPVKVVNHQLSVGPWCQALIPCGPLGEMQMTIASWTHATLPFLSASPWVALLQLGDGGASNGVYYDLYLRTTDWHQSVLSEDDIWTDSVDDGVSYGFSPTIQMGDTINVFYYSYGEMHLYINGVEASVVHVNQVFDRDPNTTPSPEGLNIVPRRHRGVRVGNNTVVIDSFRWTSALTDAAVASLEQKFHRPRSLGVV